MAYFFTGHLSTVNSQIIFKKKNANVISPDYLTWLLHGQQLYPSIFYKLNGKQQVIKSQQEAHEQIM